MKVSIITAAFRAEYMDRVWQSVLSQTHKEWEWIIVNDGQDSIREWFNKSKSSGIFEGYDVWFIDVTKNMGRFGLYARNIGIVSSHNEHIVFLDDDNEFNPDHIESLLSLEISSGKVPYCYLHIKGKKEDSKFERVKVTNLHRGQIDLGCVLYKKEYFDKFGYFRNDSQITFDWNCIDRIWKGLGNDSFVSTENPSLVFWHRRY
jgi:glycosyltransferase involved in cell wall biosynthesis